MQSDDATSGGRMRLNFGTWVITGRQGWLTVFRTHGSSVDEITRQIEEREAINGVDDAGEQ